MMAVAGGGLVGWGLCFEEERRGWSRCSRVRERLLMAVLLEMVYMDGLLVGLRSGEVGYWDVFVFVVATALGCVTMDKAWASSN